mmetsp:Transcript_67069/g.160021  ORF Transcript_67069/g.160021 Transcript_67069/m.160021 type:complete len:261 (-) Transcript_67069:463-1245(-)
MGLRKQPAPGMEIGPLAVLYPALREVRCPQAGRFRLTGELGRNVGVEALCYPVPEASLVVKDHLQESTTVVGQLNDPLSQLQQVAGPPPRKPRHLASARPYKDTLVRRGLFMKLPELRVVACPGQALPGVSQLLPEASLHAPALEPQHRVGGAETHAVQQLLLELALEEEGVGQRQSLHPGRDHTASRQQGLGQLMRQLPVQLIILPADARMALAPQAPQQRQERGGVPLRAGAAGGLDARMVALQLGLLRLAAQRAGSA